MNINLHLCRAKRLDNGEWIEGQFAAGNNKVWIVYDEDFCTDGPRGGRYQLAADRYFEVDPDTVCRCTGLADKNGKMIFEGDIVTMHQFLFNGTEYDRDVAGYVGWMTDVATFSLGQTKSVDIEGYGRHAEEFEAPICDFHGLHEESWTILGNKFDNPELLEVEL